MLDLHAYVISMIDAQLETARMFFQKGETNKAYLHMIAVTALTDNFEEIGLIGEFELRIYHAKCLEIAVEIEKYRKESRKRGE